LDPREATLGAASARGAGALIGQCGRPCGTLDPPEATLRAASPQGAGALGRPCGTQEKRT